MRVEHGDDGAPSIRLYSINSVPSLSRILPALNNAGVAIDREQTFWADGADGTRHYVTGLSVDAESAAKLLKPGVATQAYPITVAPGSAVPL